MEISEDFLFFIWRYRLLNSLDLKCVDGRPLQILNPGKLNKNAGPDFTEARLMIGQVLWAGDVEIHVRASDWLLHRHQSNPAYETVVLHVVYEQDQAITQMNGYVIPTIIIRGLFAESLAINYRQLLDAAGKFPCQSQISGVEGIVVNGFLNRLLIERLLQKSDEVMVKLAENKGSWGATFYYFLARNFGFNVNAAGFEMLATSLPFHILQKHADHPIEVEALIFGQAGFLKSKAENKYAEALRAAYQFLNHKYDLKPIPLSVWKFLRMRPANFPTVRLSQFAALQFRSGDLFSGILQATTIKELLVHFENLPVNDYWKTHYHFKKEAAEMNVQLGKKTIENLLINTVCLFLFSYGRYTSDEDRMERALHFLEQIPGEDNRIVNQYVDSGMPNNNAFNSQAILQLNKYYCAQKKCLNCGIGIKILKK